MQIYVLRHGVAADRPADGSDSPERPLTAEGAHKIELEARALRRLGVECDALVSSPLLRARQTAEIVGRALGAALEISDWLAPGGAWRRLIDQLERRGVRRAMLVGHEPDLSLMVSALTGGGQLELRKGGLALVELPADAERDGVLLWLLTPRVLRGIAER